MRFKTLLAWFDSNAVAGHEQNPNKIELLRVLPFIILHLACFAVFWIEFSPIAVIVALVLYVLRMFAITGFYHRYFSHKAFKTSRFVQFIFAFLGASAAQRGPLWWHLTTGTTMRTPIIQMIRTPPNSMVFFGAMSAGSWPIKTLRPRMKG